MIEVENLVKDFGSNRAVDGISFTVNEGDVFGFIGPNGAGKTTTMGILATLLEPTDGRARVAGHCVVNEPEDVRRVMGFMPDAYGVYDGLSVWEYLDFFAAAYGMGMAKRARALGDVMALTDLGSLAQKPVEALSKGMRQRLCVAKTLVHDPKVLILDEPAAGLDPRARIEFRALLKELRTMGKTILISSHILTELSDVCTRIGVIEAGRMVVTGKVSDILHQITPNPLVTVTTREAPGNVAKIAMELPGVKRAWFQEGVLHVEYADPEPDVPLLVRRLVEEGAGIEAVHPGRSDLEDLFMKLTEGKVQ